MTLLLFQSACRRNTYNKQIERDTPKTIYESNSVSTYFEDTAIDMTSFWTYHPSQSITFLNRNTNTQTFFALDILLALPLMMVEVRVISKCHNLERRKTKQSLMRETYVFMAHLQSRLQNLQMNLCHVYCSKK